MGIYQLAGLTAQVPIIKPAKNTKAVHIHKYNTPNRQNKKYYRKKKL